MTYFSIRQSIRPFLVATNGQGRVLMLECYYDDSGTHGGSPVVVWGGLIGDVDSFAELEPAWQALLAAPLPGKPALSQFHLSHCISAYGEFRDYKPAERDLIRNLFRTVITNAGPAAIAYGIDVAEWDRQVTGDLRRLIGGAERCAFGQVVKMSMEVAALHNEKIDARFDQGRCTEVMSMVESARVLVPEIDNIWEYGFAPVANVVQLQAADTVANESYRFLRALLDDPDAQPEPHMRHFVDRVFSINVGFMRGPEIAALVEKMQPTVEQFQRTGSLP